MPPALSLEPEDPEGPRAAPLVADLLVDLGRRYPEDGVSPHDPRQFDAPRGVFLVALLDGEPVGCGGIRPLDAESAELKRMYVAPHARGRGVGRALLAALEDAGRERGYRRLLLETGGAMYEAVGLYRSAGYVEVPAFGAYFHFSIYLGRELAP